MISDIYVLAYTMCHLYRDRKLFHEYLKDVLPDCLNDHLSTDISFVSVDYFRDEIINTFFFSHVPKMAAYFIGEELDSFVIEKGNFHIRLDGENDLALKKNEVLEFVFSQLHVDSWSIVSFYHYLGETGIHRFISMDTSYSDEYGDDLECKNLNRFAPFLKFYLYDGEVLDECADEVAKIMLVGDV